MAEMIPHWCQRSFA